ncbi:signal transduction histidine kinase [Arthrobacter pascens]|uniref:sensor histidine kinase n=1 Tax=Arthrobacter pascens TaxID=1677 RepID=UPI0027845308|nr:ATP-binding protein [Arthrobacter pascens]MDQ0633047.1 signal transduction histidine kinase [Arthrobacter pascens]
MTERLVQRGIGRYFRALGPRGQVALCQLPLTLIVLGVAIATPFAWPTLLQSPLYLLGLALHGMLFVACFVTPWERLAKSAYLIIPVMDLLAIALLRNGAAPLLSGLTILAIFPIIWLSASGMLARTSIILSIVGPLVILVPTLWGRFPNLTASEITSTLLFPLMMLAISLAIRFASVNMRNQQRQLQEKDKELSRLLASSREREKLLETVLEATDVAIAAVDSSGHYLVANNRQRIFRRVTEAEDSTPGQGHQLIFGQDRQTLLPPEKRPVSRAIAGESFADYLVWAGEEPSQRAFSTAARPLLSEDGRLNGAVVVYSDVTGWVEALAANEELISNVSHEFKTPLNSILGNVDLVLEDIAALSPLSAQRLEVVQRNSERLLALVSDLTLSASSELKVYPKRTDLASLVATSIGSARAQADQSNISFVADVPSPLWAYADPLRIGQALDNLVSNAIKYSPGGGVVSISAQGTGHWVQLNVKDTGMGMSPEDSARVFRRFFRSEAARDAAITGAGLGLSITKTIIERHGGHISCESRTGEGTTFTLRLPAEGPPPSF